MGLSYGENFIILTSTVFLWYTRLTDGRAIAYTAKAYMLSRVKTNVDIFSTVLRPSYVVVCAECTVAKRGVLEQKLLLKAYRKSNMSNRLVPK